ncbi:SMI1/KNR4 family protein [Peribacillus simplex]|uniref:SMI1/KNR4 family protein n=1 Tax=Peribacillus simplex TaxID=1478 RepID=UPI003315679C
MVSNKGFNDIELIAFSKKIGYELPNDYTEFLLHYNGGYVKNSISIYYKNGEKSLF